MEDISIVILAQENNRYHQLGDLAPFGGTTLLEWKLAQCLSFCKANNIFVSARSEKIRNIVEEKGINFIARSQECFKHSLLEVASKVVTENFFWIQITTPFMDKEDYCSLYSMFKEKKYSRLVSAKKEYEYFFMNKKRVNFSEHMSRSEIDPLVQVVNGCILFKKELFDCDSIFDENGLEFFYMNGLSTIEIKEVGDYVVMRDLISTYFKKKNEEG